MSKGNTFENDLLKLIFTAVAIANIADNAAASPLTNLQVALHNADPGETGSQTTNEVSYTGYARVAVLRSASGFTASGNSVVPAADISFPACTGGSDNATHFSIGTAASSTGKILYSGAIGSKQGAFTAKASTDVVTAPDHSAVVNDRVSFYPVDGFALPTGIAEGTLYYVKTVSGNDITLSTTLGGSTLDITADGIGYMMKDSVIAISSGVTPILTTSTTVTED